MARNKQEKQTESKQDPLAVARETRDVLRQKLAEAERAETAARVAEGAIKEEDFAPTEGEKFRAVKDAAAKVTANASRDVAFLRYHLARAEDALRPLEAAEGQAAHTAARERRTAAVANLAAQLEALPALLEPVAAAVRAASAAQAAVRSTAAGLERLGERAPYDGGEETTTAERAAGARLGTKPSELLLAVGSLVAWFEGVPAREAQRRQAAEDRKRAEHLEWRRRALLGELGADERASAEADVRADLDQFYGRGAGRNVEQGMPRLDAAVAKYRQNAGLEREVV